MYTPNFSYRKTDRNTYWAIGVSALAVPLLLVVFFFVLLLSCHKEDRPTDHLELNNLEVICDTLNLLTARISFSWQGDDHINLQCSPLNGNQDSKVKIHRRIQDHRVSFDILGLQANTTYEFKIIHSHGSSIAILETGTFETPALPAWMAAYLPESPPALELDGFLLMNTFHVPFPGSDDPLEGFPTSAFLVVDPKGELVMARLSSNRISAVRYTSRGTFLSMHSDYPNTTGSNHILETTLAGDTLLHLEYGKAGFNQMAHHDLMMTDNHQIVVITESEVEGVKVDGLIRINRDGKQLWQWNTSSYVPVDTEPYINPWGNSVFNCQRGHYIVSFRNIHQVWKIHKDTREVLWRLGKNGTIPLEGEQMFLTQHTAQFIAPNLLMVFDNGQDQNYPITVSDDHRPYSRISFYQLNDSQDQLLDYWTLDLPPKYFSWAMGSVSFLGDSYLVGASWPGYLLQIDLNGNLMYEWKFGSLFYRVASIENFLRNSG